MPHENRLVIAADDRSIADKVRGGVDQAVVVIRDVGGPEEHGGVAIAARVERAVLTIVIQGEGVLHCGVL